MIMKDLKKKEMVANLKALAAKMFYTSEKLKEIYGKNFENAKQLAGAAGQVVSWANDILKEIKWTSDFTRIPEIALNHHEKLDGSGYPNGRRASEIPIESQIMCIADIYDALIASDRPYKNRLPVEKALAILKYDAMDKKLNQDIVELFISKKQIRNGDSHA